jgi:hypothetical protein
LNTARRKEEIQQRLSEKFAGANIDHLPSRSSKTSSSFSSICARKMENRWKEPRDDDLSTSFPKIPTRLRPVPENGRRHRRDDEIQGKCKPNDLIDQHFSHEEIERCWGNSPVLCSF